MKQQQATKVVFKMLVVLLCVVLATYAGLFLAYEQLTHESDSFAQQLNSHNSHNPVVVVANVVP